MELYFKWKINLLKSESVIFMYLWVCILGVPLLVSLLICCCWTNQLVCRHWGNVGLTDWFVTIELTNRFVAGGLMLDWSIGLSLDWWLMSPVDQRSDRRRTVGSRPTAMCYLGTNYKFEGFLFNQEIQLKSWQWSCKFFTFFCFHVIICCTSVKKCWIYKFPN